MKPQIKLPDNYREAFHIDLMKDRRLMLLVNGLAIVLAVVFGVVGHAAVSIATMFDMGAGLGMYFLRFGVMLGGSVVYIVLHEAVHGVVMYRCSRVKPWFGFTGMYAYAGSDVYFDKKNYLVIALAPVVLWGVVLAVVCALVPESWFWPLYFIQLMNISGAAGDIYVTWRFAKLPKDILVQDTGVAMAVFQRQEG